MRNKKLRRDILDFVAMMSMVFGLLFLSMWIVYYIVENYVDIDSIFGGSIGKKKIYVLKSVDNEKYIPYLKKTLRKNYSITPIKLKVLVKEKKGLLFLINARKLTKQQVNGIARFVKNGGSLIFNYADEKLVHTLTPLNNINVIQSGDYDVQTPLLSAVKIDKQKIHLYDSIYMYDTEGLMDFTLDEKYYPVMWNGNYGKGNWLYYSFPFYIIQNNDLKFTSNKLKKSISKVTRLLSDIVDFTHYGYKVVKYPYIDTDKMILIDEYMDYKFDDSFIKYATKNHLKATIFINPNIVKSKINVNKNIEIASMSAENKWVLEKYTKQTIIGYSNENDKNPNVDKLYNDYGFKYTLSLYPTTGIYYNDFVVLAHGGFNDVSLNDDISKIKQNINFFVRYRIYTFTIHSYVFGQKENLKTFDTVFKDIEHYPIFTAKEIALRYKDSSRISMSAMLTPASLAVKIVNDTLKPIQNFKFRVYSKFKFDRIESNFFNIRAKIIKQTPEYVDVKVEKMNKNIEFYLRFKQ